MCILCISDLSIYAKSPPQTSVWAFNRASEWWDLIVPSFTHSVENFWMSEKTLTYLCNELCPAIERQDTNFWVCTSKEESGHRIVEACDWLWVWGHLFGVSITTVCWCVQEFCAAAEMFKEMAAYGWGLPQCIGAIDGSHIHIAAAQDYHCDYLNHKGWIHIITFKVMWMERDFSGMFSQDCLEACMMLGFWYCPHCGSLQAVEFTYQLTPRTLVGWMLAIIS